MLLGHLDSGSRAGRETRSSFSQPCRPPLVCSPCLPFAGGLPPRGEPCLQHRAACRRASPAHCSQQPAFRPERSRARCSEHPLQPEQAFPREGSRACTPAGATLGAEDRHPEGKREDPTCGKAMVGNQLPQNGGLPPVRGAGPVYSFRVAGDGLPKRNASDTVRPRSLPFGNPLSN